MKMTDRSLQHYYSGSNPGVPLYTWLHMLALVPVLLFLVTVVSFYLLNSGITFESQALLATLNTLFCSSVSILVMYLAARSYLATGSRAVLLLGCGVLVFAFINLLAGILLTDPNIALTVYNTGVLVAGLCFLSSAICAITHKPRIIAPARAAQYLGSTYFCMLAAMTLLTLIASSGITPDFYVPGDGSTPLRQAVLGLTVIEFVTAAVCFGLLYRQSRTPFLIWYGLGLLLIGMGIGTVAIAGLGTILCWAGRGGQYLGALYLLIGVWSLRNDCGDMRLPLEKALKETEEKYRRILETANEGVVISDADGRITYSNRRMAYMLGYGPEEMIGKSGLDFVDEEGKTVIENKIKARQHGNNDSYEFKFIRKDGTPVWTRVNVTTLLDDLGNPVGIMGMHTDITGSRQAEKALKESRTRLEAVFASMNDAVLFSDTEGNFIDFNDAFATFHKFSGKEDCYKSLVQYPDYIDVFLPDGSLAPLDMWAVSRALRGETASSVEYTLRRKDTGETWVGSYSFAPIRDETGNIAGAVVTARDITKLKKIEKALHDSNAQAELYLDLIGHDISNMHQVAMGYLEILKEQVPPDSEQSDLIDKPYEVLQRSARLIDNVRKIRRIQAGEVKIEKIDLDSILSYVISGYESTPCVSIRKAYDADRSYVVRANPLIADVFSNLVGNAVKHSNGGSVDVFIDIGPVKKDGTVWYNVSIEDSGPGIPDDVKHKIFRRLQRGDTKAKGMGLGLYLVKSLVESYSGQVWVEDRVPGDHTKGAKFVIALPATEN